MDFELTEDQATIRKAVAELAGRFDDEYWLEKDQSHEFPAEFYDAFARSQYRRTRLHRASRVGQIPGHRG